MKKFYKLLFSTKQGLFALALVVSGTAHSQSYTLTYNGAMQTLVLPSSGSWGIVCWGADGGDITNGTVGGGGKGGYSSGAFFTPSAGTTLNIFLGGKGVNAPGNSATAGAGGWNGGGGGAAVGYSGAGGGGATDVRVGGTGASNRVIVAGGGGGAAYYATTPFLAAGGAGGGASGVNGDIITSGGIVTPGGGGAGAVGGNPGVATVGTANGNTLGGGGGGSSAGASIGQPGTGGGPGGAAGPSSGGSTGSAGGGGGGYAGGAGGVQVSNGGLAGGGGSGYIGGVNNGTTVSTGQAGFVANPDLLGNGRIIITRLCNISLVPTQNPICIGASITLTTDAISGISWSASGSTGNTIVLSPTVTTSYSVTGTSTANCSTTNVITVTVNPLPVISAVVSPTTLCVGGTATIVASGANTYTWSTGPTGATTTVNPGTSTVYNIAATSVFGCFNTNTVAVSVNTNSLTISSNTTICIGNSAMLTANGAVTYSWSNGIMFQSVPVSPTVTTTYTATALDVYNCPLSNMVSVAVAPLPVVTIAASKNAVCKGESVTLTGAGATTYTWSNGFVGATVIFNIPVDVPYYYTVTGADASGCTKTTSVTITGLRCVGINEIESSSLDVLVSPNPGSGLFNLQVNSIKDDLRINVYNMLGMFVKSAAITSGNNTVDLQNEKAGIYFIYVNSKQNNASKVIKLIKE